MAKKQTTVSSSTPSASSSDTTKKSLFSPLFTKTGAAIGITSAFIGGFALSYFLFNSSEQPLPKQKDPVEINQNLDSLILSKLNVVSDNLFSSHYISIDSTSNPNKYIISLNEAIDNCSEHRVDVIDTIILNRYNRPVQAIDTSLISNYEQKIKTLNEALGRVKHSASSWRHKYNSASHSADAWKNKYNSLKASTDSIKNPNKYLPQKVPNTSETKCDTCTGFVHGTPTKVLGGRK